MLEAALGVLLKGLITILILMGFAAYMTLLERVLMARMQLRIGPNRVGAMGASTTHCRWYQAGQ